MTSKYLDQHVTIMSMPHKIKFCSVAKWSTYVLKTKSYYEHVNEFDVLYNTSPFYILFACVGHCFQNALPHELISMSNKQTNKRHIHLEPILKSNHLRYIFALI